MSKALLHDTLMRSVGSDVVNKDGKLIGEISEITRDADGEHIEYVILKSQKFFGHGTRVFAIPASSSCLDITEEGSIILLVPDDIVQFAKGVSADKCPKPNFRNNPSVFELYNYKSPEHNSTLSYSLKGGDNQKINRTYK